MRAVTRSQFLVAATLTLFLLLALNLGVALRARNFPPQLLVQRIARVAPTAQNIFFGDSQMEADVDPAAFAESCRRESVAAPTVNFGLGATHASEHCLLFDYLLAHAPSVENFFYSFHDDLLTTPVPAKWQDLGGNRALCFLFPKRAGELLFPDDAGARLLLRIAAGIPLYAERITIWSKVERVRRTLGAAGLPPVATNRFGRALDFAAAEPADERRFAAKVLASANEQQAFNRSFEEILRRAKETRRAFHLILMPVMESHRQRFYRTDEWHVYQDYVARRVAKHGVRFINAADWIPDEYFLDALHLAPEGARIFSVRLATATCPQGDP